MDRLVLENKIIDPLLEWCDHLVVEKHLTPDMVAAECDRLAASGAWDKSLIGHSAQGSPIYCLSHRPENARIRIVAYGYPHPDEPIGASALLAFAQRVAYGHPPPYHEHVEWNLVLCADPDQAAPNQPWIESPSLDTYLRHNWHPHYLGLEVDYAFPIDSGPFYQPPHWAPDGARKPLQESLAIADLIEHRRPHLLGLMHNEHVSGSYNFISHRPHRSLVDAFDQSSARYGIPLHLGERPDPGKRWIQARPDFLKERRLQERRKYLERQVGEIGARRFLGCVSVAQYLESLNPEAVVLTPEVGFFTVADIACNFPTLEKRQVSQRVETTRRGERWIVRGKMLLPDGTQKHICYHIHPVQAAGIPGEHFVPLTRGMAGVEAVELRRYWLGQADNIWKVSQPQLPYFTARRKEREAINVPSARVKDRSMLIFRTASTYAKQATVAQAADFAARWRFHDCRLLGYAYQLYLEQDMQPAAEEANILLTAAQRRLPQQLVQVDPSAQARSQIARLLLTAQVLSER